jgi:hypothetical protein
MFPGELPDASVPLCDATWRLKYEETPTVQRLFIERMIDRAVEKISILELDTTLLPDH